MKPHVVAQGEYLASIAYRYGVAPDTLWNDPRNAALKRARPNRNILCPGDLLYVPEAGPSAAALASGASNHFVADVPMIDVALHFLRGGQPLPNEPFEVVEHDLSGTTDGDGHLTLTLPVTASVVRIVFPRADLTYEIGVGHLDPIEEASGARMRLRHLGCAYELVGEDGDVDVDASDRAAVMAFQRWKKLPATGDLDADTRAALVAAFGC